MNRHRPSALEPWEQHIHAFVELSCRSNGCIQKFSDQLTNELAGITVGVKDIIDVRGMRTRNGSEACRDCQPATQDAPVVNSLRRAGAHIVGKTTTTEFAFTDPANCRNPYDLNRTPGGSSSGSGAAVAAGMVDMALGTQTAGSLCRPAAYCGVIGFKPTYGALSTEGVTPLAASFDTVGIIARSIEIARKGFLGMATSIAPCNKNQPELISALLPTGTTATAETLEAFYAASNALKTAGIPVRNSMITANVSDIVTAHRIVMIAEAALAHKPLLAADCISLLQPRFRAALEAGATISTTALEDARGRLSDARQTFWQHLDGIDMVLTLPVPDAAPSLNGTTGFQDWLTPWTVFGGPLVCLPWGLDSLGRPRSVMLAGRPEQDMHLMNMAERLQGLAPALPRPVIPEA